MSQDEAQRLRLNLADMVSRKRNASAEIGRLRAALVRVEAVMSIVEPRSDKGEYLAALFDVREALGKDGHPSRE